MKNLLFLFTFLTTTTIVFSQTDTIPSITRTTNSPLYKMVDEMPLFSNCETAADVLKRSECSKKKAAAYVEQRLNYPKIAKDNGVKGIVIIRFIVEIDGSLSNAKIVQDIGAGCGQEVLRVMQNMPKWVPPQRRGKAVRAEVELPVQFEL